MAWQLECMLTFRSLTSQQWHALLWPDQIITSQEIVRHLGYPLGWNISSRDATDWVLQKFKKKISYWKLPTWPLHVRMRIVQSILIAYLEFFLPIDDFMALLMHALWQTCSSKKGLYLLKAAKTCSPKTHGGLNIPSGLA